MTIRKMVQLTLTDDLLIKALLEKSFFEIMITIPKANYTTYDTCMIDFERWLLPCMILATKGGKIFE